LKVGIMILEPGIVRRFLHLQSTSVLKWRSVSHSLYH
jgi:hypothetical protein